MVLLLKVSLCLVCLSVNNLPCLFSCLFNFVFSDRQTSGVRGNAPMNLSLKSSVVQQLCSHRCRAKSHQLVNAYRFFF